MYKEYTLFFRNFGEDYSTLGVPVLVIVPKVNIKVLFLKKIFRLKNKQKLKKQQWQWQQPLLQLQLQKQVLKEVGHLVSYRASLFLFLVNSLYLFIHLIDSTDLSCAGTRRLISLHCIQCYIGIPSGRQVECFPFN